MAVLEIVETEYLTREVRIVEQPMTPEQEALAREVLAAYIEQYERRFFGDLSWFSPSVSVGRPTCSDCPRRMGVICCMPTA